MKKVFIIHGLEAKPNGAWRPWLMGELGQQDVWACSLAMPTPANPVAKEWVAEITRQLDRCAGDEVYLVGHSLGVPAILRFLEAAPAGTKISGAVLVAGPYENIGKPQIQTFFDSAFNFEAIRARCDAFHVIHAHDDANVPFAQAETLAGKLGAVLTALPTGAHLNGVSGTYALPAAMESLEKLGAFKGA